MLFLTTEHTISVVPCRLPCVGGDAFDPIWGYWATCAACPRWRGARRLTFERAEQDGLAHIRATGAGR
jgi:hypothetical protein